MSSQQNPGAPGMQKLREEQSQTNLHEQLPGKSEQENDLLDEDANFKFCKYLSPTYLCRHSNSCTLHSNV